MNKEVTLLDVFSNAKDVGDLLQTLKEHQDNGIKYVLSYGFRDIAIQQLIDSIKRSDTSDLEEICRAINFQIHS